MAMVSWPGRRNAEATALDVEASLPKQHGGDA
jgi:hypothetical protein